MLTYRALQTSDLGLTLKTAEADRVSTEQQNGSVDSSGVRLKASHTSHVPVDGILKILGFWLFFVPLGALSGVDQDVWDAASTYRNGSSGRFVKAGFLKDIGQSW